MRGLTHDVRQGLILAIFASISFGTSGTLATGLLESGWSPGAVVVARVLIGGTVLALPAAVMLRGRWGLLHENWPYVLAYGAVVVAFTQFAYFSSVAHLDVGVALLIEYAAPIAVLGWLWVRHGEQPTRTTAVGAMVAMVGLVLVLDLVSGADLDPIGVLWGIAAMAGNAAYFVLSARRTTLPPVAVASAGLLLGGVLLGAAGALGMVSVHGSTDSAAFAGFDTPFWVPLLLLGVVSAALSYLLGILASQRLGSRLTAFVSLLEVLTAVVLAWLLLGQQPGTTQLVGGLTLLAGIVLVKYGEPEAEREPVAVVVVA